MTEYHPIPADGMTIAQAAEAFPWYSVRALRGLRANRTIPSWKVCNHVVFSRADLEALPLYAPPTSELMDA